MSAITTWNDRVAAHHRQSEKAMAQSSWSDDDFWQPYAQFFRQDPRREGDPVLDALLPMASAGYTALDVGGGAGRLALPLALRCRHVSVVEPSASMIAHLRESAADAGISNYSVIQATWEDADVALADLVLCAHVLYGVADLEPFIRKLEASASALVVILSFVESPMTRISAFWQPVHGEPRIDMPALPELVAALWDMGIYPDVRMLAPIPPDKFETREVALTQLRNRLYVKPDTPQDARLQAAMDDLLTETDEGVWVKGVASTQQGFISWTPNKANKPG